MEKPQKVPGPIRTGAVIPTLALFLIAFVFIKFFFDHSLKSGIEWVGTNTVGAEVNIGRVKTSFINGSFVLSDLQITDKSDPTTNALQIGQIRFAFSWDALLRLKFVVRDAGIDGIAISSPRQHAGWVKPAPSQSQTAQRANEPGALEKIETQVSSQVHGLGSQDPMAGLNQLLNGTNQSHLAEALKSGLKSEARIKELQAEVKTKQKEWQDKLAHLPQKKDFDELAAQAKTLKFDLKNPKEFAENLKTAKDLKDRADSKLKEIRGTTDQIKADADQMMARYKEIDSLVNEDLKNVQSGLNLSDLNAKDLSRSLFANYLTQKLGGYAKYLALAKKYTQSSKQSGAKEKEELIPHKRGSGKTYRFPITTGYPLLWIQKATISSKATDDGFSGNVNGELTNLTSDPHLVGRPTVLEATGDFPRTGVMKAHLKMVLDHVDTPTDSINLNVGAFPLKNLVLANSTELNLSLREAVGQSNISAVYQNSVLNFEMENTFKNAQFSVESQGAVRDILTEVLKDIPQVQMKAQARGALDRLNISVDSNLGSDLSRGLQKLIQAKLDAVRKQIKDEIENRISGPKKQLTEEINKATGQANSDASAQKQQAEQGNKQVSSAAKTNSSASSLQDQIKQKGQQLLKGLKF
jgi:uncharacterized protein (TIGR03545 family)